MKKIVQFLFVLVFASLGYGAQLDKPLADFKSDRLSYTLVKEEHLNQVVNLLADPNVCPTYWPSGTATAVSVERFACRWIDKNQVYLSHEKLDSNQQFRWAVFHNTSFVGMIGVNASDLGDIKREDETYSIVLAVCPDSHGKGYGTEMEKKVKDMIFIHTKKNLIVHETNADNTGSIKVAEKCGFEYLDSYIDRYGTNVHFYKLDRDTWVNKLQRA